MQLRLGRKHRPIVAGTLLPGCSCCRSISHACLAAPLFDKMAPLPCGRLASERLYQRRKDATTRVIGKE